MYCCQTAILSNCLQYNGAQPEVVFRRATPSQAFFSKWLAVAILVILANLTVNAQRTSVTFQPFRNSPIESRPQNVIPADFNNDNQPGPIVSNQLATVPCTANFSGATAYPANNFPYKPISGDFNNDGAMDLVIINAESQGKVSVLFGNRTGSFSPPVVTLAGNLPVDAVAGDFNRDGKLDLALISIISPSLTIILNTGNGAFGTPRSYPLSSPGYMAVGDFNGDRILDLAVSDSNFDRIVFFKGNGDGTFIRTQRGVGGNSAIEAVALCDLDQDGWDDVIGTDNDQLYIFRSLGDGTFVQVAQKMVGASSESIATGDFNHDGKIDIAVSSQVADNVSLILNLGNLAFSSPMAYPAGRKPESVISGDFDNDGLLDLAIANYGTGGTSVSLLMGDGNGGFRPVYFPTSSPPLAITSGDFNNDGRLDLATADLSRGTTTVRLNVCTSCPTLALSAVPNAIAGVAYNQTISATGGSAPYQYTLSQGILPSGLSLSTTGLLSGTPTQPGTFTFTVSTVDTNGCNGSRPFVVRVLALPTISTSGPLTRIKGSTPIMSTICTVGDADSPAGSLIVHPTSIPPGIMMSGTYNNQGTISAFISADCSATLGPNLITLRVMDSDGLTATATLVVIVALPNPPVLGTYLSQSLVAGSSVTVSPSQPPNSNGGQVPAVSVSASAGFVGTLFVDQVSGVVTVNPVVSGNFTIFVTATGTCGVATMQTFSLTVQSFQKGPIIEALSPGAGPVNSVVVITGLNLEQVTSVRFNGTLASFKVDSSQQITAVVPEKATTGLVEVSGPTGSATGLIFTVIRTK